MSINDSIDTSYRADSASADQDHQWSVETKPSSKTSEFFVFLAAVAAVVITAFVVGQDDANRVDPFSAQDALRYITYLSIGYMLARGLAKSGSRESRND